MKKPNITEGEWKLTRQEGVLLSFYVVDSEYEEAIHDSFHEANAQAISAVPEMIDALIDLINLASDAVNAHGYDPSKEEAIQKAEKALKKAGCTE